MLGIINAFFQEERRQEKWLWQHLFHGANYNFLIHVFCSFFFHWIYKRISYLIIQIRYLIFHPRKSRKLRYWNIRCYTLSEVWVETNETAQSIRTEFIIIMILFVIVGNRRGSYKTKTVDRTMFQLWVEEKAVTSFSSLTGYFARWLNDSALRKVSQPIPHLLSQQVDTIFFDNVSENLSIGSFIDNGKLSFSDIFSVVQNPQQIYDGNKSLGPPTHLMSLNHEGTHTCHFSSANVSMSTLISIERNQWRKKHSKKIFALESGKYLQRFKIAFPSHGTRVESTLIAQSSVNKTKYTLFKTPFTKSMKYFKESSILQEQLECIQSNHVLWTFIMKLAVLPQW